MVLRLAEEQRLKSNVFRLIAWFTLATFLSAAVPWISIGWFLHQNSARLYQGAKWHAGMALSVEQGLRSNVLRFFAWFALVPLMAAVRVPPSACKSSPTISTVRLSRAFSFPRIFPKVRNSSSVRRPSPK